MSEPVHPSLLLRKIIHFDMDAFYASVELRDRPDLIGQPVVIGGRPEGRGVVATASYEARKFGIHSAMSCAKAYRLCPEAVFLRPNFEKYKAVSTEIRLIFERYTDIIQPLSLDEAYLDVTESSVKLGLRATQIAKRIQDDIWNELQLTGSAGVAPNKLVAKIASDVNKPKGITVVMPEQVLPFMGSLALRKIHGIGPATEKRLAAAGLRNCRDVWVWSAEALEERFGSMGPWLYARSRGIDERSVETERERKSLGKEETFREDLLDWTALEHELGLLCTSVERAMQKREIAGKTVVLKVKYADFHSITRSQTLEKVTDLASEIYPVVCQLLKKTEAGVRKIRLLGVSLSGLTGPGTGQPKGEEGDREIFGEESEDGGPDKT